MVLELPKFTFGVGDRFAHQAGAQLAAFVETAMAGVEITPVWNKSNREHLIIGSEPASVRKAADEAIAAMLESIERRERHDMEAEEEAEVGRQLVELGSLDDLTHVVFNLSEFLYRR